MNTTPPLILASGSPRRADLLRQAGIAFEVIKSEAPELGPDAAAHFAPRELVLENARTKARAVTALYPDRRVLAADTEVALDGRIYGKPADLESAVEMLLELSGRTHEVWTGVCVSQLNPPLHEERAVLTRVTFRPVDETVLRRYVSLVNPLDKAGAYGFQEHGGMIVERFEGSESNIIGLPMQEVMELLGSLHASMGGGIPEV
ncbi:MAG: nucleoside triphosphate pyrophosphatase [Verrucomicrobiae bacterium]|nr:nucleoside triphosphate pyrophosphatase [Verrucomicrobiae bacterium]